MAVDWDSGINGPYVSHPPEKQPGLIHVVISRIQEEENHPRSRLNLELAYYCFCHIVLAKASHKSSSDLRDGKRDSTSFWEE